MWSMRNAIPIALITFCSLACAPRFQTQVVAANSVSFAQPTMPTTLVAELPVAESSDDEHTLRYAVHLPRALELEFVVTCPGGEARGTLGETFEAYRQRRLAEIEEQRRAQAALVGSIVGAAVPSVRAGAQVSAPGVQGTAQATVDPGQAAAAAAYGMSQAQLPPGDVGAQTVEGSVDLGAMVPGSCFLTLENRRLEQDISGVVVDLALDRTVDLVAEEEARIAIAQAQASELAFGVRTTIVAGLEGTGATVRTAAERQQFDIELRGAVVADLLAAGADPGLRERERAAAEAERLRLAREEQARLQAELALQSAQLQIVLEAQQERDRVAAEARAHEEESIRLGLALRVDVQGYLIGLGADPMFRQRRFEEEQRLRAEEMQQWQAQLAAGLALREALCLRLVALGAVERPPMPPAPVEVVPPLPFPGAVWVEGGYVWRGGSWVWVAGQWASQTVAAGLQLGPLTVGGGSVSIEVGAGVH
jgi:hypothetical protein